MRAVEVLTRIGFVLLSGCSFEASCNTDDNLNMDKAQSFVSDAVEQYTGVKPTKVSCPENVKAKTGADVVCTAEVAGVSAKVTLKQTDSKGNGHAGVHDRASRKFQARRHARGPDQSPDPEVG